MRYIRVYEEVTNKDLMIVDDFYKKLSSILKEHHNRTTECEGEVLMRSLMIMGRYNDFYVIFKCKIPEFSSHHRRCPSISQSGSVQGMDILRFQYFQKWITPDNFNKFILKIFNLNDDYESYFEISLDKLKELSLTIEKDYDFYISIKNYNL